MRVTLRGQSSNCTLQELKPVFEMFQLISQQFKLYLTGIETDFKAEVQKAPCVQIVPYRN